MLTADQRYWWRIALELKLRKCSGDAFQEFFSTMMGKLHRDDFVRVRPFGNLGDKGCDGYLSSTGQVFQCYGALNGDSGKVAYLISKMASDYAKASEKLSSIMKEWHMAHNLVDGLPVEAVQTLESLRKKDTKRNFGFIGYEGFEARIFSLAENDIEDLLGTIVTTQDVQNMQPIAVRDVIAFAAESAKTAVFDTATIKPVPPNKLDFNQLPGHWRALISGGWQNAHIIDSYIAGHFDPMIGERIAQAFRVRYIYLKSQNLPPAAIMDFLYESITGPGAQPERQVAAQALLAYLFESCDIFEDEEAKVPQ